MKLDIDLNKLSLDELDVVIALAKKQRLERQEAEQRIAEVEAEQPKEAQADTETISRLFSNVKQRRVKRHRWNYDELFPKMIDLMERSYKFKTVSASFLKISGVKPYGEIHKYFREWCRKKGIDPEKYYSERKRPSRSKHAKVDKRIANNRKRMALANEIRQKEGLRWYEAVREAAKRMKNNTSGSDSTAATSSLSSVQVLFPEFPTIKNEYAKIFQDMLKNLIVRSTNLTYDMEGRMLDLNKLEWENLCQELILRAGQVAQFFGVQNRYRVVRYDKQQPVIIYK